MISLKTPAICLVLSATVMLECSSDRPVEERCFPEHPGGEPDPQRLFCGLKNSDPMLDAAAAGFADKVGVLVCHEVSDPAECNRCDGDTIEARLTEEVLTRDECLREKGVEFVSACVWMPEESPSGECCYVGMFFTDCVFDSMS